MKIFKLWLIGICLFSLQALANDLKENVDYIVLKKPISNMQNKVIEIFNIGCPHCAYYNTNFVPNLLEFLPKDVEFLPYHVAAAIPIHEETSNILVVALAILTTIIPSVAYANIKLVLYGSFNPGHV